ncbi:MAG: PrsW family glutamic-type intramembrane protease [Anaerolineae bacterium]|nr:PrsW family glutamic-type intramembrane protease [Anaerolineae bacterium]MDK1081971.1 PrsW family glutamic-type intramembrane protease [Anaerolineae bacterium]MDK1119097.1 PrsW family glutamic-type intramembrane protease [Anaerolineae bacterium]
MTSLPRSIKWRTILLFIFSLTIIFLIIISAIGILLFSLIIENELFETTASQLSTVLFASSLIGIGLLLLPIAWLSIQRLRGRDFKTVSFPIIQTWVWITIPGLWLFSIILATLFYDAPGAAWYVPFLHLLSIALPIYIIIRIGTNRLQLGSGHRAWSVFGTGMTLSPLLAAIVEIGLILIGVIIFAVFLGTNSNSFSAIESLVAQLERAPDIESTLILLGPYLNNPLTLLAALAFLSFIIPVIEEILKSIGVLLIVDRITSNAQGFALGVLSGAGFAFTESLFASITPDDTWGITLGMRGISSGMHMLASGLVGWGIAAARLDKQYLKLIGLTILAIVLHGLWNAGAVFTVAGGLRISLSTSEFDLVGPLMTIAGVGLLLVLMGIIVVALFLINRYFHRSENKDEVVVV